MVVDGAVLWWVVMVESKDVSIIIITKVMILYYRKILEIVLFDESLFFSGRRIAPLA